MEGQLQRVEKKRQERVSVEKEAKDALNARLKEVAVGANKKQLLNAEIQEMWRELEGHYHNTTITEMENELKARIQ